MTNIKKIRVKKKKKAVGGVFQAESTRHGLCWAYDIRVLEADGKIHRRTATGFATKDDATVAAAKMKVVSRERQIGILPPEPPVLVQHTLIGAAVDNYIKITRARWESKHGKVYADRNSGQINALKRWAVYAGLDRRVDSLTRDDFVFWQQQESRRGLKQSSIRRRINSIRAALNHARESKADLIGWSIPKRPNGENANQHRIRILTDDEILSLSEALASQREWRDAFDFFCIALGCGGRMDEMVTAVEREDKTSAGIKWTDANKHFGTLRLFAHKTGKERVLHVPAVVAVVEQRKRDGVGGNTHVFTCRDHWLRAVYKEVSNALGILYGQQVPGGWTIHDLRHTCLTNLLQAGVDLGTVRDFAGHHSIAETTNYIHATDKSRSLAAQASSCLVNKAIGNTLQIPATLCAGRTT